MSKATVKAELKNYVSKKTGLSQIRIVISFKSRNYIKPISMKVRPDQFTGGQIVNHPHSKNLNSVIAAHKSDLEMAILALERKGRLNVEEIKKLIGKDEATTTGLYEYIEEQIKILAPYRASKSTTTYESQLRKLKEYCPHSPSFEHITPNWLSEYKQWMIDKGNKNNTIWGSEKFLNFMFERAVPKYLPENPYLKFERTKYDEGIPRFLYPEEVTALEKLVNSLGESDIKRAGMHFLADTDLGLRVSDLMALDNTIDVRDGRLIKKTQKGKTIVSIKLNNRMKEYYQYTITHPLNMSPAMYDKYLKKLSELAGLKTRLSSHVARHTLGRRLAAAGMNISVARKILGHKSIKSTERYYHITDKEVDDAMSSLERE